MQIGVMCINVHEIDLSRSKGIHVAQKYVMGEPNKWLDVVSKWQSLWNLGKEHECTLEVTETGIERSTQQESSQTTKRPRLELDKPHTTAVDASLPGHYDPHSVNQGSTQNNVVMQTPPSPAKLLNPKSDGAVSYMPFRVSCRCSGKIAKKFTSQELGRAIGIALSRELGWKAELRNPMLEVYVHLNDIHCVVGIPILRLPLASRDYIKSAGLRSTVAWAMAYLCDIQVGSRVLDPMCGLGTILLEAAKEWPNAYYHGIDNTAIQLQMASVNVCFAKLESNIDLTRASVTELPLLTESIDIVICDIPFGKKFKITQDTKAMMPFILKEMVRVLRGDGTLVLLLSQELSLDIQQWQKPKSHQSNKGKLAVQEDGNPLPTKQSSEPIENVDVKDLAVAKNEQSEVKTEVLASLIPEGIFPVSLGVTEASIHRYKKIPIT
ncbi:THUMP domain-containing protein 2 isoform X2 [Pristis pectinata]|uniref:THUMP domain-containing protein 2 isoform X2 n=1 Tax=Pristis pectinata TaxID=685728 RepID=UPI00223D15A9|nr:THUMP domain-containing protein 2 isoform X2 [Pristis pectinata]